MLFRHQGANLSQRKPVTADLMGVLYQLLELSDPDNVMPWAACCDPVVAVLGRGSAPLCPVLALTNYLHLRGPGVLSLSSFFRMAVLVKGPPIFVFASHLTGSWHSGEVLGPQLENWGCYYSRPERRS